MLLFCGYRVYANKMQVRILVLFMYPNVATDDLSQKSTQKLKIEIILFACILLAWTHFTTCYMYIDVPLHLSPEHDKETQPVLCTKPAPLDRQAPAPGARYQIASSAF